MMERRGSTAEGMALSLDEAGARAFAEGLRVIAAEYERSRASSAALRSQVRALSMALSRQGSSISTAKTPSDQASTARLASREPPLEELDEEEDSQTPPSPDDHHQVPFAACRNGVSLTLALTPPTEEALEEAAPQDVRGASPPDEPQLEDGVFDLADLSSMASCSSMPSDMVRALATVTTRSERTSTHRRDPLAQHLWPLWRNAGRCDGDSAGNSKRSSLKDESMGKFLHRDNPRVGDEFRSKTCMQRFVVRPSSFRRMAWDLSTFVVMGWDCIVLPMQAFPLPETDFTQAMGLATTVFWTVDIISSFFTGYQEGGTHIEMRPMKIAARYMRSWFLLDLPILIIDWLLIFQQSVAATNLLGFARVGKALRIARVLRMLRLLRILKVVTLLSEMTGFIHSEMMMTVFGIVKLTAAISVLNHFIACCWYFVGSYHDAESTWAEANWVAELERQGPLGTDLRYRYATSLHWSLTQFTPASMEIVPHNTRERTFVICVIVFALVSFSSFLSSITSSMTHLRQINYSQHQTYELVRRYITDHKVSLDLGNRIYSFIREHKRGQRKRVHEGDIAAFAAMPDTLMLYLHVEVYMPILLHHPFFQQYRDADNAGSLSVCHMCMMEKSLLSGQEHFVPGETAVTMSFVTGGKLEYAHGPEEKRFEPVSAGDRICEMVLWMQWEHRGRLTARASRTSVELMTLDSASFRSVVARTVPVPQCRAYARLYADRLLAAIDQDEWAVSDLWGDFEALDEMAQLAFVEGNLARITRSQTMASQWSLGSFGSFTLGKARNASSRVTAAFFQRFLHRSRSTGSM
mmetsp:Transcript_4094/g.8408  ORF Transcript_4094/g.8408 Transcript_4094/m.8408 type:complete len:808 (-) Transcript_4094:29-2452(-)